MKIRPDVAASTEVSAKELEVYMDGIESESFLKPNA
jgi:hypothetical protein